jgi:hypothetical protein
MTVLYRRGGYSTQLHRPNLLRHKGDDGVVIGIDEIIDSSLVTLGGNSRDGAESSQRPRPEAHCRTSCRNTPAFIGRAELDTSHIRRRTSSPGLGGDSTNNTASRECVPIR